MICQDHRQEAANLAGLAAFFLAHHFPSTLLDVV
jgi:hypothetical protein